MRRLKIDENKRKQEDTQKEIKMYFDQVCHSPGGIEVLRFILGLTGYQLPVTDAEPSGKLIFNNTVYNAGRANIWLTIRALLPREQCMLIENPIPVEPEDEEQDDGNE